MTAPNSTQIAAADYGEYPTNYREIVDAWMRIATENDSSLRPMIC